MKLTLDLHGDIEGSSYFYLSVDYILFFNIRVDDGIIFNRIPMKHSRL